MKKIFFILLLAFMPMFSNAQSINHKELNDFWQDVQAAITGGYGTKVIRLSQISFKGADIEKMIKTIQKNRCILSALMNTKSDELSYNPDMNEFIFICMTTKGGRAFLRMKQNDSGFFRLINFETNGNIICPVTNIDNTNMYDKADFIGDWSFEKMDWIEKSADLRQELTNNGHDEKKIQDHLDKRVKELETENAYLMTIEKVKFNAKKMEIISKNGNESYFWRLSYNQLQVRKNEQEKWIVWKYAFRINKDRNLDFFINDYSDLKKGCVRWGFVRKK